MTRQEFAAALERLRREDPMAWARLQMQATAVAEANDEEEER